MVSQVAPHTPPPAISAEKPKEEIPPAEVFPKQEQPTPPETSRPVIPARTSRLGSILRGSTDGPAKEVHVRLPATQDNCQHVWKEFLQSLLDKDNSYLHSFAVNASFQWRPPDLLILVVQSLVADSMLNNAKADIIQFFKERTDCEQPLMEIEVVLPKEPEIKPVESASDIDRLEQARATNPAVGELIQKLGLIINK